MKWIALCGGLIAVVCLEYCRRKQAYWRGPFLVQQLREWHEKRAWGDEPTIRPLDLPSVKPLKGQMTERPNRVTRFKGRAERG